MSFDLFVYAPSLPTDLIPLWEAQLAHHGMICTFYPGFHPVAMPMVFLPIQVQIMPDAFPRANHYGLSPLYTELELDYEDALGEYFPEWKTTALRYAPATLHPYLQQASCCLYFRSAAARTLIEFRLQYFAAATLAVLTTGILEDPQAGKFLVGAEGLERARVEADAHEARAAPDDWMLPQFTGWPDSLEGE
jgi:hypothetical protein